MYEKYVMDIIAFEESCVFADLEVGGDSGGVIVEHSVTPNFSDK